MKISEAQEEQIRQAVLRHHFKLQGLAEDLIDHIYCYLYEHGVEGQDFDKQVQEAIRRLAPEGLETIENETFYLLNFKKMILMKRFIYAIGLIGAMAFAAGLVFKLFYWPYANILTMLGSVVGLLIFLPLWALDRYKYQMVKKPLERWKLILGISSGVLIGLGTLMKFLHLMGAGVIFISGSFLFVVAFLPLYFLSSYRRSIEP